MSKFRELKALGYDRLLPIMPPHAKVGKVLSKSGELVDAHAEPGKTPAIRGADGLWHGVKGWSKYHAAQLELQQWAEMGASVGLLATENAFALDVDAYDPVVSDRIERLAEMLLGKAPKRVGRAPKFALIYRTDEPLKIGRVIRFESTPDRTAEKKLDRVEIPSQLVVDGLHPVTNQPYSWPTPLTKAVDLPCVSREQLDGFFRLLRTCLPTTVSLQSEIERTGVVQEALRGDPEMVAKAVRATPNDSSHFRYEEWVRLAAAIRGALPDDEDLGLELFKEFSDRTDLPDRVEDEERVYWSVQPPFGVGASFLFNQAAKHTDFAAERWFEPPTDESAPEPNARPAGLYGLLRADDLQNLPKREFLVKRYIPENALGFLYGDPGCGKSFLALDLALHVAYGLPMWHDVVNGINSPGSVLYIAGEGVSGMGARVKAWLQANADKIRNTERRRFGLIHEPVHFMEVPHIAKVADTIRAGMELPLSLIIVDTVSRALPGSDENLQKDMTQFVQACDALRRGFMCTTMGVHHTNRVGGMRGSSVLSGAGDFVLRFDRVKGADVGRLTCEKQKDDEDGWSQNFGLEKRSGDDWKSLVVVSEKQIQVNNYYETIPDTTPEIVSEVVD